MKGDVYMCMSDHIDDLRGNAEKIWDKTQPGQYEHFVFLTTEGNLRVCTRQTRHGWAVTCHEKAGTGRWHTGFGDTQPLAYFTELEEPER